VKQNVKGPVTLQSVSLDKIWEILGARVDEGSHSSSRQAKSPSQSLLIELRSANPIEACSINRLAGFSVNQR
jgi:hypothetical protein